MEISALELVPR